MPCHACNSIHSFWITFYALKFRTKAWKYLFLLFFFNLPGTVCINEHFCLRITNFHLYSLGRLQQCNMCVSMNSVQFMEKTMKSEFKGRGRVGLNRETIGRLEKGRGGGLEHWETRAHSHPHPHRHCQYSKINLKHIQSPFELPWCHAFLWEPPPANHTAQLIFLGRGVPPATYCL